MLASTLDLSGKPDDGTYKPLGDEVTFWKTALWKRERERALA